MSRLNTIPNTEVSNRVSTRHTRVRIVHREAEQLSENSADWIGAAEFQVTHWDWDYSRVGLPDVFAVSLV